MPLSIAPAAAMTAPRSTSYGEESFAKQIVTNHEQVEITDGVYGFPCTNLVSFQRIGEDKWEVAVGEFCQVSDLVEKERRC